MPKKKKRSWSPTADDLTKVLHEQNPWWSTGEVPAAFAFDTERPLAKFLWKRVVDNRPKRFQVILGPRRVGKSTCMYQTIRHLIGHGRVDPRAIMWLRMDHPLLMEYPLGQLVRVLLEERLRKKQLTYLFLDELTYANDWDLWLKTFYDEKWPVQIIASSSSAAALRDRKVESGVGRWEEQFLPPYLFSEYLSLLQRSFDIPVADTLRDTLQACSLKSFDLAEVEQLRRKYLLIGGFPELLLDRPSTLRAEDDESVMLKSQRILRGDAVQSAIYKDIPQAFGVDNPMMLERLLYTLGGQAANILSPNTICQTLNGMSQPTFDRYLSYLEKSYLVFTLPNYSGNESSVQKRGRKLYFVDGAVRNAALQRGTLPLGNSDEMGMLVENLIAGHLYALSQQSQVRLYHWRDKEDEVDLIYDHPDQPLALEIATGKHGKRGLESFAERYARYRVNTFLVGPGQPARMPDGEDMFHRVGRYPLDLFLLAVSAQAEKELEMNLLSRHRQA